MRCAGQRAEMRDATRNNIETRNGYTPTYMHHTRKRRKNDQSSIY